MPGKVRMNAGHAFRIMIRSSSKINSSESGAGREAKHLTLARRFSEQIRGGELQPGDKLPTFVELRRQYGVGRDTLDRMYAALERDGLIEREQGRGIFVAREKKTVRRGMAGFVNCIDLHQHPYYMHLLNGVREEARLSGVEILLLHRESTIDWEQIDGIIYTATMRGHLRAPQGKPEISLIYEQPHRASVVADDYVGMREAMEHLWELGHRRIALLTTELLGRSMSKQRLVAYRDALAEKAPGSHPSWLRAMQELDLNRKSFEQVGYEDMRRWLAEGWKETGCTAILAHNDETAVGVIQALEEAGLRVPMDISVIGFDGTEIATYHRPQITTVKAPLRQIGRQGFRMLMEQVERPLRALWGEELEEFPPRVALPTRLQIGRTTGPAGGPR